MEEITESRAKVNAPKSKAQGDDAFNCRQNDGLATNCANSAKKKNRFTGDSKKRPGRENSQNDCLSCCSACGLASVSYLSREQRQMLNRKRNGKTLHSWHFYAFLGALGVLGDFRCCFRGSRGKIVLNCSNRLKYLGV
jgi:hypothetical protein